MSAAKLPAGLRRMQLAALLAEGETVTAATAARMLGIAVRTVYRDFERLAAAGLPIDGDPGVGYRLAGGAEAAGVFLSRAELRAALAGAKLVRRGDDAALARAAATLIGKLDQAVRRR